MRKIVTGIGMLVALASGALLAAPQQVGPAAGNSVVAEFKQMGAAVETPFTRFAGSVNYDPQNVGASSAVIEVETASLDFGDPAFNAEVAKKAWFDSAAHPKGVFRSTAIKAAGPNKLDVTGTLTIKGKAQTIAVPVTVGVAPAGNTYTGTFTISRKAFGIGDAAWDGLLEDQVVVRFQFLGKRQ